MRKSALRGPMIIALGLVAFAALGWLGPETRERMEISGVPVVGDGDSFRLGQVRVRLLGIDAPEITETCADQWTCGLAARDRLRALASGGITCKTDGRDVYDRVLAVCHAGGEDVAAVLVREGLARAYRRYSVEESLARGGQAGLWRNMMANTVPAD